MTTTLELRDRLAGFTGHVRHEPPSGGEPFWTHESSRDPIYAHPIPDTADFALASFPEGWGWRKMCIQAELDAAKEGTRWSDGVSVSETDDFKADRLALAVKCWEAQAASR